jgi:voltage-gated potassium channel
MAAFIACFGPCRLIENPPAEMSFATKSMRSLWDIAVLLTAMILAVEVPLLIVIGEAELTSMNAVSLGATVVFLFDLAYQYQMREAARNRRASRGSKLKRGVALAADIVACIPFAVIMPPAWSWLELVRLVKVVRVQHILGKWKRSYAMSPGILRMANFLFWMAVLAHWLACGWLAIGGIPNEGEPATRYIKGLYWCVTTLTTVGYGDITPQNNVQRIYTIFVMIAGVGFYGFVIGNVASLLSSLDVARSRFLEKTEQIDAFLRHHAIPPSLRDRIHDYYQYLWESKLGAGEDELLTDLVHQLKTDIMLHIRKPLIEKVPVFANAGETFLREVIYLLKPQVYLPGDIIIRQGELGDSMYFLSSGEVEVVSAKGERLAVLKEGAYFGELALLKQTPRTATVRAMDFCHAYELSRDDLRRLMSMSPEFEQHIMQAMKNYR